MSAAPLPILHPPALIDVVRPYRPTGKQVRAMVETGVLPPDLRFELVEGQIVEMSPISNRHNRINARLHKLLATTLPEGIAFVGGASIRVNEFNELIPNLIVYREQEADGLDSPFTGDNVLLVIEISQSTRAYDLQAKAALYAAAGIAEYLVIDLIDHAIIVHRDRAEAGYATIARHQGGAFSPLALPHVSFDPKKLFG